MEPDLLILSPPDREPERRYVLSVLLEDWLGLSYRLDVSGAATETAFRLASDPDGDIIAMPDVLLSEASAWLAVGSLPASPLPTCPIPDWAGGEGAVPVLYAAPGFDGELSRREGRRIEFRFDLLGAVLFLLTRYEEHVLRDDLDQHGRFRARTSALAEGGWIQWPVADMYAHLLAAALQVVWPRLTFARPAADPLRIGHDVDHPASSMLWRGGQRLRVLAADLLKRHDAGRALRRGTAFLMPGLPSMDPLNTFGFLMSQSERAGRSGTYFFLTRDTEVPEGSRFSINDPWARTLMSQISLRGHRIALHGSYDSHEDADRLKGEWRRLEEACQAAAAPTPDRAVRQHFLRWTPGTTWAAMAEAGLLVDATMGHADVVGYRAGTARSFPAFDLRQRVRLGLRVEPLHVMDVTLLQHMGMSPDRAIEAVAGLCARTRRFGGTLSLLWHNSSLETRQERDLYRDLITLLAA